MNTLPMPKVRATLRHQRRRRWALGLALASCLVVPTLAADPPAKAPGQAITGSFSTPVATLPSAQLTRASEAVIGVIAETAEDATSATTLGRKRTGTGIVIGKDGLVLTIGYLILEAEKVTLITDGQRTVPARVVGYDVATGFGLVQSLVPLSLPSVPLGEPASIGPDETLVMVSGGEGGSLTPARLLQRRPYAANWEYLVDGALFTAPSRSDHAGAALLNMKGELLGIGSLLFTQSGPGAPPAPSNMFVPVDLLKPILMEMQLRGRSTQSRRAWLGVNCYEDEGTVRVLRLNRGGPAERGGLKPGDRIVRIDGSEVADLTALWKALWSGGAAERDITLDIERGNIAQQVQLRAVDRQSTLKQPGGSI